MVGYKDLDKTPRRGRPVTARQLPAGTHPKCPSCDRYKCVDDVDWLPHHGGKRGTQGRANGGDHCCAECRDGTGTHGKYCHAIYKNEERLRAGAAPEGAGEAKEVEIAGVEMTERPVLAGVVLRVDAPPPADDELVLPPGIKACPACGMLLEKISGDNQMMCGCEAKPAGGTYRKALAGGGCGSRLRPHVRLRDAPAPRLRRAGRARERAAGPLRAALALMAAKLTATLPDLSRRGPRRII